ncbi:MAG: hypothetical protein EPN70_06660 [Paraburkholderia sp.]|uniref:hypothetical protein n=1 Tax=Paraburkholderia sp. TaxID=1926495 RepID=UPI00121D4E08|nr:hypothetical protein [Paraburkholderia sp.]TAM06140.1 MAG: hypothetical protein EPN70_06660 [Paraburkholderia sp.]TAM28944.1 MAG: hypothetical protein EPN59_14120 [Paraburkholderia sp.]
MKKMYNYRGFDVTVEAEPMRESSGNVASLAACGFVAVVRIGRMGATRPAVAPMRLMSDNRMPFVTVADVQSTGYSAGQRVIDDVLAC